MALGERDPDSLDFYAGPADAVADIRRHPPTLAAIKRDAVDLSAGLQARHDPDSVERRRVGTLIRDLAAIAARVDLLTGVRLSYDAESRAFFGVAPETADDPRPGDTQAAIADIVGRGERLVDRYAAFAERFTIPADRVPAVMQAAIDACRQRTLAHVALPPGERVTLELVRDKPWSAFSRYRGDGLSVIQINTDFRFTVDQALQIACHETYPGHHTRNVLNAPRRDAGRPEQRVQMTFSPEALVSEGSAMLAADVAFPAADRVRVERDRLFPLAGLDPSGAHTHIEVERLVGDLQFAQAGLARRYLDGDLEFARAVTALEAAVLVPHAEALVKYFNQYRSYVTTYTIGRQLAAAQLAACIASQTTDDMRWRCFLQETTTQ